MTGQTIILGHPASRTRAHRLVDIAPPGAVLNIREGRRTTDQNSLMWALLSQISQAKPEGRNLPPETWKALFMSACGHQVRFEPALDGDGVVAIGFRSSKLRKSEMSDLIECIHEYAARHEIPLSDEAPRPSRSEEDMGEARHD